MRSLDVRSKELALNVAKNQVLLKMVVPSFQGVFARPMPIRFY
jgi:hypothetical protein